MFKELERLVEFERDCVQKYGESTVKATIQFFKDVSILMDRLDVPLDSVTIGGSMDCPFMVNSVTKAILTPNSGPQGNQFQVKFRSDLEEFLREMHFLSENLDDWTAQKYQIITELRPFNYETVYFDNITEAVRRFCDT